MPVPPTVPRSALRHSRATSVQPRSTVPAPPTSAGEVTGVRTRSASKAGTFAGSSTDNAAGALNHDQQPHGRADKKRGTGQDNSSRPSDVTPGGLRGPAGPSASETVAKNRIVAGADVPHEDVPGTRRKSMARAKSSSPGNTGAGRQQVRGRPSDSTSGKLAQPARSSQTDKSARKRAATETDIPDDDAPRTRSRSITRVKSSSPPKEGPGPYPQTFDFSGQNVIDHWVPMVGRLRPSWPSTLLTYPADH